MEREQSLSEYSADAAQEAIRLISHQLLFAKVLKAKYDSLLEVGFTDEQAMGIIKARGISI